MSGPTREFWEARYRSGETPWDRGTVNAQLQRWLESGLLQSPCRLLVPGCGAGWEVAELAARGFRVTAIDYADAAVSATRTLLARHGLDAEVIVGDVLDYRPEQPFDAIYEQTCLCALHPDHWTRYAATLHRALIPGGSLCALFMQSARPEAAEGFVQGPPYHCDIHAMRALFPDPLWEWQKPPLARVAHPAGIHELAVHLRRSPA